MCNIKALLFILLLYSCGISLSFPNGKDQIDQMVFFGDSYSDNGNTFRASQSTYPGAAYFMGHFLNGLNWSEYLAKDLEIDLLNHNKYRNYAYGQAQISGTVTLRTHKSISPEESWEFKVPDLAEEISEYLASDDVRPASTLYFIFIGTNDFLNATPQEGDSKLKFIMHKLKKLDSQIYRLKQIGADKIVLFNMRDLSIFPLTKQLADQYGNHYMRSLKLMISQFNRAMTVKYQNDKTILLYDVYSFDRDLVQNVRVYKFNNTEDFVVKERYKPCYVNKGNYVDVVSKICTESRNYLFYDRIHETTFVNYLTSRQVFNQLLKRKWIEKK